MDRHFRLSDYARAFATRDQGGEVAHALTEFYKNSDGIVVIDFEGVDALSYDFMDQFLAKIKPLIRQRCIAIVGWSNSLVDVIIKSMAHRHIWVSPRYSERDLLLLPY